MEQIVYADVLFIINFSMDFLSLFIVAKVMRKRPRPLPLSIAATLGAVYAIASLFLEGVQPIGTVIHLSVAALMCYISFTGGFNSTVKSTAVFIAVNFLLGGGISALYYMLARGSTHSVSIGAGTGTVYTDIPPVYILLCAGAVGLLSTFCGRLYQKKRAEHPVTVEVFGSGCSVKFESMCDTGNLLCDPYNGRPVIITGYITVLPILPFDTQELFRTGDLTVLDKVDPKISHRVHVIPSKAVGGSSLLLVYTPDKIKIRGEEREACLGILPTREKCDFGGYAAITPSLLC
ncbi:MAG: sigma-E processing peptidase SpoIIGA [Clostridia bacterium]|nr:sigma-E processing peptidase SpoIIGA [Clostridia bacterium]